MTLSAGSIAFVGFNADGNDDFAIIALDAIPAGTAVTFRDDEWNGTAWVDANEATMVWTATSDIAAGTIVSFTNQSVAGRAVSAGTLSGELLAFSATSETLYAYIDGATPTFLAAIVNDGFSAANGVVTGTGLTIGSTAVQFTGSLDGMAYNGPRSGEATFADYLALIGNIANWSTQLSDGTLLLPFSSTPFTLSAGETQTAAFSASSLTVSQAEGNSGATAFTFTVERAGGTAGNLDFSGSIALNGADNLDFVGGETPIAFNGTILAGATSATVTVNVAGDVVIEANEGFSLTLDTVSNGAAGVTAGLGATNLIATATILNDDAPAGNIIGGVEILDQAASLAGSTTTPTATNDVSLVRLGGYVPATGNAEVVSYDAASHKAFVVNAIAGAVDILAIGADGSLTSTGSINIAALPDYGALNSVSVKNGVVAVAYAATGSAAGHVALFDANGALLNNLTVGVGPDMLTFTPDGMKILVANEAEAVSTTDNAVGSVSIIDLSAGAAAATVSQTVGFASLNGFEAALKAAGLALFPGQDAAADIEPEYIAVSADGATAYVTLQEVNAVAIIDLTDGAADRPSAILPLGGVDNNLAGNEFDASDRDGAGGAPAINIANWDVISLLQPDSIATFSVGGENYFITANEGDARVGTGLADVDVVRGSTASYVLDPTAYPNAATLKNNAALGRFNVLTNMGDTDGDGDIDQIYGIGGRGLSIFRQNADGTIEKVRETGGEFEKIIAALPNAGTVFNGENGGAFDTRSDNKGPEPEGVSVGVVNGRTYAFVTLERVGGVMTYDVTDPANAFFVGYTPPVAGDYAPETSKFISAAESPTGTALLLTANELAGSGTTLYAVVGETDTQTVSFEPGPITVSQYEGDSGSTSYSFNVYRTGGTLGAVNFTVELDSAASTGDFVGVSGFPMTINGVIAAGQASATITVDVAGDLSFEGDEAFTLTLTGAANTLSGVTAGLAATGLSASGAIVNDDYLRIYDIQGSGATSAFAGQSVTTRGVVTAIDTNGSRGFWIQDAAGDGNDATSDGVFVFTGAAPTVAVGDLVQITGNVAEFIPGGAAAGSQSLTEITAPSIVKLGTGSVAATLIGGPGGLLPPTESIAAGVAFYASLEGMLVTVKTPHVVGATNSFGEIFAVVDNDADPSNGLNATGLNGRGGLNITGGSGGLGVTNTVGGDFNPERIQIDDDSGVLAGFVSPGADVGAVLSDVTGVVGYNFGNYEIVATQAYTVTQASTNVRETTALSGSADHLLLASYNCENLDPNDGAARFATIAGEITGRLNTPDIVALQEIQDNNGATNDAVTSASTTLQLMVDALNAATGSNVWAYLDNPFIVDDANGGEPGGNIRNAYVYRTDRVSVVAGSVRTIAADGSAITSGLYTDQAASVSNPFYQSRPPLVADFSFNGQTVTVIDIHSTSKGGSGALMGAAPQFNGGEVQRAAQAQAINNFVDSLLGADPTARIVVAGDANEFAFEEPMSVLKGTGAISGYTVPGADPINATATYTAGGAAVLHDAQDTLPVSEQYDYVFEGNSQTLDHMLISDALVGKTQFDVVHINSEFATQTSDHDPLVASIDMSPPNFKLQVLHFYGEAGILASETAPIMGAMIDQFKTEYQNTLVFAEGDTWIPGPWLVAGADPSLSAVPGIGATALGRPDIAIMNAFGVNASAIGNHEFDLGSPVVSGAIAASGAWGGALFPFITSNLDFSADNALRGLADTSLGGTASTAGKETSTIGGRFAPYAITTVNGEKIGIVGATNYDLLSVTSPNGTRPKDDANPLTNDLQEVAAYVQASIDALTALGVNKIMMVDQLDTLQRNRDLAPLLTGVDIMIAGGGHERMGDATDTAVGFNGHSADFVENYPILTAGADGAATLIVTTDTEYTYLGRSVVEFDSNGEIVVSALDPGVNGAYAANEATLQAVYGTTDSAATIISGSVTGTKVQTITDAIDNVITTKDAIKFGYSNVYLEGDRVFGRTQETNLGNITADANAEKAQAALGEGAFVVSLKNGGGLRASIGTIEADGDKGPNAIVPGAGGNVSLLDVENALRFDNKLMVFDTTAQGLLNILEFAAGLSSGPAQQSGGYAQVGGVRFSYDTTRAAGDKIRTISLVDDNGVVTAVIAENGEVVAGAPSLIQVVTLNFTANGGDGYPIKANATNFRYLLTDGTLSAPINSAADFTAAANIPANALGEQKAFEDYMLAHHGTPETAYDLGDTPASQDIRIENLAFRDDVALDNPVINGDGFANVLHVTSPGNDTINGRAGNDDIATGAGADVLNGGSGVDTMAGGAGDDLYFVDNAGDIIVELDGEGFDLVRSSANFTLAANVESLTLTGPAVIGIGNDLANTLNGNGADNQLEGRGGDDRIRGGLGADTMIGGLGDDLFYVDNAGDRIVEANLEGADTVYASVSYTLGANVYVETLRISSTAAINATGSDGANYLVGNDATNQLSGMGGNDTLNGKGGDDTLFGGAGNDRIYGGAGNDVLWGDAGVDSFIFDTALDASTNIDVISDFTVGSDTFRLSSQIFQGLSSTGGVLDTASLAIGDAATSALAQIIYNSATGALLYDADGTGAADATQFATADAGLALANIDFRIA